MLAVKAARNGIFHRNDVAPLTIRAKTSAIAHFVKGREFNCRSFYCPVSIPHLSRTGTPGVFWLTALKVGGAPLVVRGHRTGYFVKPGEVRHPEIFVAVQVAAVGLRCIFIGGEKRSSAPLLKRIGLPVSVMPKYCSAMLTIYERNTSA